MELTFEWDDDKARKNLHKHKISFEETKTTFFGPNLITFPGMKNTRSMTNDTSVLTHRSQAGFS